MGKVTQIIHCSRMHDYQSNRFEFPDRTPSSRAANVDPDRSLAAYDYELPEGRIAQNPVTPRDTSKLLVVDSPTDRAHRRFRDLPDLLQPGDLLVLNDTRVIPARLYGRKTTGAPVEVLLLEERSPQEWLALVKPGKRLKPGATIEFQPSLPSPGREITQFPLRATVTEIDEETGGRVLHFHLGDRASVLSQLEQFGRVPLPPYITESDAEATQYQTVYARQAGSAAAPTAGLHFTEDLFDRLQARGIDRTFVTLHVGIGTFRPVEVEDVTAHKMHGEWVEVPQSAIDRIRDTRERGGRVIAVGTTVVRSLEAAAQTGQLQPFCGKTELFIYPGYQWRAVDGLITNFHLPKSSLLMLVSALIGRERLLELYRVAIADEYRFYSFGDAMLILPEARGEG